jgi:predicted phosphodiesterase
MMENVFQKIGIITDVHANTLALEKVIKDGHKNHGVEKWVFLGDAVGYGTDPVGALTKLKDVVSPENILLGNHDAWLAGLEGGNLRRLDRVAEDTLKHHHELLLKVADSSLCSWWRSRWTKERSYPMCIHTERVDVWLVHGFISDDKWPEHIVEYIYPWPYPSYYRDNREDAFESLRKKQVDGRPTILICGHSHVPCLLIWRQGEATWLPQPISVCGDKVDLTNCDRAIINPGSVGQPRIPDSRTHAAYGTLDIANSTFEFHRVEYDPQEVLLSLSSQNNIYAEVLIHLLEGARPENPLWRRGTPVTWSHWKSFYQEVHNDGRVYEWRPLHIDEGDPQRRMWYMF